MMAVVKADAYGHGAPACVEALLDEGCDFFVVSCLGEGVAVRNICRSLSKSADVLILGAISPLDVPLLLESDLIATVISFSHALSLSRTAKQMNLAPLRVHVAVDTGMHRVGFPTFSETEMLESAESILKLSHLPCLQVEGIFSHFARADEAVEEAIAFTETQALRFTSICKALEEKGLSIPFRHLCNSAALLRDLSARTEGVRPGIALYGYGFDPHFLPLRPVMKLQARVIHLHTLQKGETVGYGGTYTAPSPRLIATLPIGYADGFLRSYSGARVTLHTQTGDFSIPVVGAVCMDQCMLDVTDTDAKVGDTVTLFGDAPASLSRLASLADTIDYECLCLISGRVPRRYLSTKNERNRST
jgi:alanine racemase